MDNKEKIKELAMSECVNIDKSPLGLNVKSLSRISNGGYYAIKGFEFQIDKAILELLNARTQDDQINIEQIQDIDSDNFVMQVKYKETQRFTSGKIKKPIIQLLEEFSTSIQSNTSKVYYLYCYFLDQKEGKKNIDLDYLNRILGESSVNFNEDIKQEFINRFVLFFSPTFQEQFENVIKKIKEELNCEKTDEAIFYYSNIANLIRKIIVDNPDPTRRTCTRKKLIESVMHGKQLIFDSAFKEYKGEYEYLKYIKKNFLKASRYQENFVFIGNINVDRSVSISKLILDILGKLYKNATHDVKPITFIVSDNAVENIKIDLINWNILFNDGYEHIKFNEKLFFDDAIVLNKFARNGRKTETLEKISFQLRILSGSNFNNIKNHKFQPAMIYYFDFEVLEGLSSISFLKIDKLSTKHINDVFIFT